MINYPQRSSIFKVQGPWRQKVGLLNLEFHQVSLAENKQEWGLCKSEKEGFDLWITDGPSPCWGRVQGKF